MNRIRLEGARDAEGADSRDGGSALFTARFLLADARDFVYAAGSDRWMASLRRVRNT